MYAIVLVLKVKRYFFVLTCFVKLLDDYICVYIFVSEYSGIWIWIIVFANVAVVREMKSSFYH